MGLLSNFIAGAASAGASYYGQKALDDMKLKNDMEKSARLLEMQEGYKAREMKNARAQLTADTESVNQEAAKSDRTYQAGKVRSFYEKNGSTGPASDDDFIDEELNEFPVPREVSAKNRADVAVKRGFIDMARSNESIAASERADRREDTRDKVASDKAIADERRVTAIEAAAERRHQDSLKQRDRLDTKATERETVAADREKRLATKAALDSVRAEIDGLNRELKGLSMAFSPEDKKRKSDLIEELAGLAPRRRAYEDALSGVGILQAPIPATEKPAKPSGPWSKFAPPKVK